MRYALPVLLSGAFGVFAFALGAAFMHGCSDDAVPAHAAVQQDGMKHVRAQRPATTAARAHGRYVGRPATDEEVVARVEGLARTANLSVRKIHRVLADGRGGEAGVSRPVVGRVVKRVRAER